MAEPSTEAIFVPRLKRSRVPNALRDAAGNVEPMPPGFYGGAARGAREQVAGALFYPGYPGFLPETWETAVRVPAVQAANGVARVQREFTFDCAVHGWRDVLPPDASAIERNRTSRVKVIYPKRNELNWRPGLCAANASNDAAVKLC
jgi:hypothetical protein